MNRFLGKRTATGLLAGLCLMGCIAAVGLVSPLAKGYLSDQPAAGDTMISTNAALVRVHFTPHTTRQMVRRLCATMDCGGAPERI